MIDPVASKDAVEDESKLIEPLLVIETNFDIVLPVVTFRSVPDKATSRVVICTLFTSKE